MSAALLHRQCWRWLLPLAVFAACLNPQPDDNPMATSRRGGKDAAPAATMEGTGTANSGLLFVGDDDQRPQPTESSPPTGSDGASMEADAGAPAPSDAGVLEGDGGVAGD